jgi:hypothetical protein
MNKWPPGSFDVQSATVNAQPAILLRSFGMPEGDGPTGSSASTPQHTDASTHWGRPRSSSACRGRRRASLRR